MTVTLGFDVEEFDFPLERGRGIDFGTQLAVSSEGLEFLLDLLARLELRATFYTTANFALHRTDLVRRIVAGGHEVASHDYYHGLTAGSDPAGSRRTLEELTGQRIVGYRAPRLAAASSAALAAAGYRYRSIRRGFRRATTTSGPRAPCRGRRGSRSIRFRSPRLSACRCFGFRSTSCRCRSTNCCAAAPCAATGT